MNDENRSVGKERTFNLMQRR